MSYNPKVYAAVRKMMDKRERQAKEEADGRAAEVRAAIPGIADLDAILSATGTRLMREIRKGKEGLSKRLSAVRSENEVLLQKKAALLSGHGYPADYTDVHYHCSLCSDTGFLERTMCSCMKEELYRASVEASGIGALIRSQTFENFSLAYYPDSRRAEVNLESCRRFANKPEGNLLLLGGTGLGKTHLSSAIAGKALEKAVYVVYETAPALLADFEAQRFGRGDEEGTEDRIRSYSQCELLIIDDLGTEIGNQFTVSTLYSLLNDRINRRKPTVVSTNLTPGELVSRYTERIASRLLGEYTPLFFEGTDIRKQKKYGSSAG